MATLTGHLCFCPPSFTGSDCSIPTNPCSSQPCFRNGTCLAVGTQSYICVCPTGYLGARCEICNCPCNIYPCMSIIVRINNFYSSLIFSAGINGGVCRSTATGGVVCVCPAGYTGLRWYF